MLTLAAYNAGPARARRWLRRNGDPRQASVDAIDWVETIPFGETRNYVQRVMEKSYCQKLCMGLSCGGAILAFSIHEFDASNDLGELI